VRIIVSGGGTGGHIYPALTIIRALQRKVSDAEFLYVGTAHGMEADIIPKEGLPFATVDIRGFEHHLSAANLLRAGKAMHGVLNAMRIVRQFRPHVAIGTGGYVCGPILLAASLMHVPSLIQEQNVIPGITNRILSKFVTKIAAGSAAAARHFPKAKTVVTGNPIRAEVMGADARDGFRAYGFDPKLPVVLVSGGSLGARAINRAMIDILVEAQKYETVQYLHATGKKEYEDVVQRLQAAGVNLEHPCIKVVPYLYDMPQAEAMAKLAIFRAGAIGLAELTARGIPAILVPYPYAAENHQEFNAREMEKAGAAKVILNSDLTSETLASALAELLTEPSKLADMAAASKAMGRPQAAEAIANLVLEIARR